MMESRKTHLGTQPETPRRKAATRRALRRLGFVGVATFAAAAMSSALASPSIYPTGVTRYDPTRAYNSYVLFGTATAEGQPISYLIDMDGNVVHTWSFAAAPTKMIDPAQIGGERGVIGVDISPQRSKGTGMVPGVPAVYLNKAFGFVDWNGKLLWEGGGDAPGGGLHQHHDWARLPDGSVLVLGTWLHKIPVFGDRVIYDPVIYELNPKGDIVWRWVASEHLNELDFTKKQLEMMYHSPIVDYLHMNDLEPLGPNRWAASGDTRFAPDNIMISARNANFTAIIDRKTGHVVWEIGPTYPSRNEMASGYDKVPGPITQISGQHDSHMIPEGLPGAGDILVFDNQGEAGYPPAELSPLGGTRVLEINPATKEVVWEYSGRNSGMPQSNFYSSLWGSAQRLPNGNTLIDEAADGRVFQVTPSGAIVWEYVSPYQTGAQYLPGQKLELGNMLYRAEAIPYDWAPQGTARSETPVEPLNPADFHVPQGGK